LPETTAFEPTIFALLAAPDSHPVGDEDLEGEDGQDHPQRRRPVHQGGEAHLRVAAVQRCHLQADEQVPDLPNVTNIGLQIFILQIFVNFRI
jgi:hypothetical protein